MRDIDLIGDEIWKNENCFFYCIKSAFTMRSFLLDSSINSHDTLLLNWTEKKCIKVDDTL